MAYWQQILWVLGGALLTALEVVALVAWTRAELRGSTPTGAPPPRVVAQENAPEPR